MMVPCSLNPHMSANQISLAGAIVLSAHTIRMAMALLHFLCLIQLLLVSHKLDQRLNKLHNILASASLCGGSIEGLMTSRNSCICIIVYSCRHRLLKPKPGDTGPTLGVLISTLRGLSSSI